MKLLKYVLALVLLAPMAAMAGLNLPEPKALLAKAQQSRVALREVVLDIDMNVPEMRDQVTFEKYFYLMDDLDKLSVKFKLDEYYPQMVSRLSLRMVGNGMRWLDPTKDTPERLQYYIRWMDTDTLNRFLDNTNYQLELLKDKALLAAMAKNIETVLPQIDARAEGQIQLMAGFRRLVTDVATKVLRDDTLSADEVQFWLGKLMMPGAISSYLEVLNENILKLTPQSQREASEYIKRLLVLNGQVYKLNDAAPTWLISAVGDSMVELLLRAVRLEIGLSPKQFSEAIAMLGTRQTSNLIQQWTAQEKLPSEAYAKLYLEYSKALIARGQTLGLARDTEELQKWLGRTSAPVMAQKYDIEGNYLVKNERGEKWYFTIAYARENMLIASLGNEGGTLYKTFYNITYSAVSNSFVASEREPDTDHEMNPPVKFTVNENGQITLVDPFVRDGARVLRGEKVQSFTNLWTTVKGPIGEPDGTYEGSVFLPSGTELKVRVIVTSFNGYTLGRLESDNMAVDLNIGSKATDGVLIMTSGRNLGTSWLQVRGHLTPEGLKTYLIVGGRGQSTACTILKRVDNF